jgi:hypothetical protein
MSDDASPFFIRPHRFDDPDQENPSYPRLDWHRRLVLDPGEQVLWRGRVELTGYLLGPSSGDGVLHWSLLRPADVTITDRRLAYVCEGWEIAEARAARHLTPTGTPLAGRRPVRAASRVITGQVRWQWPSRLHLLPAMTEQDRGPQRPEQVLLVCDSMRTIRQPGLALGGGVLHSGGARELTHLIRRAIARFRLANPGTLELSPPERDALSVRAGTGLFVDELGDPGRGVNLPGALVVEFLHRDDYYRRAGRSSPSRSRAPRDGTSPGLWRSGQPGSAS